MAKKLMTGVHFGRLVILKECRPKGGERMVLAECDCGKKVRVILHNLRRGHTRSCGCLKRWNPDKSIHRLNRAIEYEIYQMNKYQSEYDQWAVVMNWLEQRAKQLNSFTTLGGGNGEVGIIPACSTQ